MDFNLLKAKLDSLNGSKKSETKEKIDYSKYYWKPQPGKYQIRIVPSLFDKSTPFREIFFHYNLERYPILALSNWGEPDPIIEFSQELKKTKDKENYLFSKKFDPKMRVFAPIIVRGEEEKGVRLWEFGKDVYKDLMGIALDEDYGNFTDIAIGSDFTIEAETKEAMGRKYVGCTVRIKPKQTPLSKNADEVELWLNNQPDILELNRKLEYDELKEKLAKYLTPADDSQTSDNIAEAPISTTSLSTKPSDKFDDLFQK